MLDAHGKSGVHKSSSGEMKTSLRLMIYSASDEMQEERVAREPTFSCCMCFKSLSSRYVRLLRTGVLKGFIIFLIATEEPVSWSFAELTRMRDGREVKGKEEWYQTRPKAPRSGWMSEQGDRVQKAHPFRLVADRHNAS